MKRFFVICRLFFCVLALAVAAFAQKAFITTVAGSLVGSGGDGGPAVEAQLNTPGSVAVDSNGNLYIADLQNERIRKVGPDGTITTVAGNGQRGFSPDGVNATDAALDLITVITNPNTYVRFSAGIAVDQAGNLYIADTNNHRIRRVGHDGVINTIAGNGVNGYAGDGGSALEASLSNPTGVFVARNNEIYIADNGNGAIRKVSDGKITTVANGFWWPSGVAVSASGDVYIADSYFFYDGMVFKVDTSGNVTPLMGSGSISGFRKNERGFWTATSTTNNPWEGPESLALDQAGNVVVADTFNDRVAEITAEGIVTLAGSSAPLGVAIDGAGNIYFADTKNNRVQMIFRGAAPKLTFDTTEYCTADLWKLHLEGASPSSSVQVHGTSNGMPWDVLNFGNTGVFGTLDQMGPLGAENAGQHTVWLSVGESVSNSFSFKVASCAVTLTLDANKYCTGSNWNLKIDHAPPDAAVNLSGVSNNVAWDLPDFGRTASDGSFAAVGNFASGSEGEHFVRARIGNEKSSMFRLSIGRCVTAP